MKLWLKEPMASVVSDGSWELWHEWTKTEETIIPNGK
jgi:hypothetical protein